MLNRRAFLGVAGAAGTALAIKTNGLAEVLAASQSMAGRSPAEVAQDEFYWREIQQSFALDRTVINLNTGHHCSQPTVVLDAVKRYLDMETMVPVRYGGQILANMETVRRELAKEFGCETEEMKPTSPSPSSKAWRSATSPR